MSARMEEKWGRVYKSRLADQAGFNRSNVDDWQEKGSVPRPMIVKAIAEVLDQNPIDAYIAAGFFTKADLLEFQSRGFDETDVSNEALAAEVLRRMDAASNEPPESEGGATVSDLSEHEQAPRRLSGRRLATGRRKNQSRTENRASS